VAGAQDHLVARALLDDLPAVHHHDGRGEVPVRQEIWAWLSVHYALAVLVARAAEAADLDPDRISFTRTLRLVRRRQFLETELPPQFPLLHHRRRGRRVEPLRISRR
jgi:hypothetical protein